MQIRKELGGYVQYCVREILSFRTNTTNPPDQIRDGKSGLVVSVVRASAGLYTVTLNTKRPIIANHVYISAHLEQAAAPTAYCDVHYVKGSWTPSTGTFQVKVFRRATDVAAAAASDPDATDRIYIELTGSVSRIGQDPN